MNKRWLPWLLTALAGLTILAPLCCFAQEAPVSSDLQDYAQREADAVGLEEFAGGHAGLIVLIVVLAAALILVAILVPW
jgi:putative copper export protein